MVNLVELFCCFWLLGTIERSATTALVDAGGVELAANNGVAQTDVFYATAAQKHYRVLLEVVTLSWNVRSDLHAIGKADTSDLTDSGVWLAGGLGSDARTNAAFEGCWVEGRAIFKRVKASRKCDGFCAPGLFGSTLARKLVDGCHEVYLEPACGEFIEPVERQLKIPNGVPKIYYTTGLYASTHYPAMRCATV